MDWNQVSGSCSGDVEYSLQRSSRARIDGTQLLNLCLFLEITLYMPRCPRRIDRNQSLVALAVSVITVRWLASWQSGLPLPHPHLPAFAFCE